MDNENNRIKKMIETEFSIQSLDDMADMFFKIARSLKHPLKNINLELHKSWREQIEDNRNKRKEEKKNDGR